MPSTRINSATELHRQTGSDTAARGLGVFSLALGAMEIVGAASLARMLGIRGQENVIRMCGVREIAQGVAILTSRDPTPWIWARVAGDALDIGTLLAEERFGSPSQRTDRMMALGALAGVTALDLMNARQLSRENNESWSPPIDFSARSGFPDKPAFERHGRPRGGSERLETSPPRFSSAPDLSGESQPAEAM